MSQDEKRHDVIEWLNHIKACRLQIDYNLDRVTEHICSMDMLKAALTNDMPHDPNVNTDAIPKMVEKLLELLEKASSENEAYLAEYQDASRLCHRTPEAAMLWMHTVEGRTWHEVGRTMGYSMEHALRKSNDAVDMLWDLMPAQFRKTSNNVNV